ELGAMAADFNAMIDELQSTGAAFAAMRGGLVALVGEVKDSAAHLSSASVNLTSTATSAGTATNRVRADVDGLAHSAEPTNADAPDTTDAVIQLSQPLDGMAAGATEQARQVQAASSTASQMASGVGQVADRARQAAEASERTRASAAHGSQAV